jgi:cell wall-associated NlpC family hydrolase
MAVVGRRTAVVAAAGGMVMTGAMPAVADSRTDAAPAVDTTSLTAPVRAALETAPAVQVPANAEWGFASPAITIKENPKPKPAETRRAAAAAQTSRSEARPVANAPVPQSVSGNAVLEIAARYVGVPYVHGGSSPDGFDCSGFTSYVYGQLGISLPRTTSGQRDSGTVISREDAQPGDLIWSPGHVGIYAGDGMQIDAPRPGKTIQFRGIWQSNPVFIRLG